MSFKKNSRSTGKYCCVHGCRNSNRRLYEWKEELCTVHVELGLQHKDCPCLTPYCFYSFPRLSTQTEKRLEWVKLINRKNFTPGKHTFVCSVHFPDGRPTEANGLPTLKLGYDSKQTSKSRRTLVRKEISPRKKIKCDSGPGRIDVGGISISSDVDIRETLQCAKDDSTQLHSLNGTQTPISEQNEEKTFQHEGTQVTPSVQDVGTLTGPCNIYLEHSYCSRFMCEHGNPTLKNVEIQVNLPSLSHELLSDNDCIFYTGLRKQLFLALVLMLSKASRPLGLKVGIADQVLLVLCKLRLGLLFGDLGRRFNICGSYSSKIFKFWLPIMSSKLRDLILWLPRETIRRTIPDCFKKNYPYTTCIIDCTEVFTERGNNMWTKAVTYSNYKSHNTLKFLVGIAPNGLIMFLSECYGGRTSDNFIVQHSGFLSYLLPHDQIMGDRGFTVEDLLPPTVSLNVPAFTRGREQLTESEVTLSRRVAAVRIHIGNLKNYRILKSVLPLRQRQKVDDIVTVCAALCNLRGPIV